MKMKESVEKLVVPALLVVGAGLGLTGQGQEVVLQVVYTGAGLYGLVGLCEWAKAQL